MYSNTFWEFLQPRKTYQGNEQKISEGKGNPRRRWLGPRNRTIVERYMGCKTLFIHGLRGTLALARMPPKPDAEEREYPTLTPRAD
jgi:hypothetical protein